MSALFSNEHEEASSRRMIVTVRLEVLGQVLDARMQEGDLNLRATGIRIVRPVLLDNREYVLGRKRQRLVPFTLDLASQRPSLDSSSLNHMMF